MKRSTKLTLILIVVASLFRTTMMFSQETENTDSRYESLYNKGLKHYEDEEFLKALYYFQQATQINTYGDNLAAYYAGLASEELNWYANAISYFEEAMNISPNFYAVSSLANAYANIDEDENTIYYNTLMLDVEPNYDVALNNIGNVYSNQGDSDRAMAYYQKPLEADPNFIPSLHNIGLIYSEKGNSDSAIYYYKKVLALDPKITESNIGIVEEFKNTGKSKEEYQSYCKTIIEVETPKIDKNPLRHKSLYFRAFAYQHLGETKLMEKDLNQALPIIDKLITLHPSAYGLYNVRADMYDMLGEKEKATQDYKKVLQIMPTNPDALNYMKENNINY